MILSNDHTPAILFIVFARPDVTEQVLMSIRSARPSRLYVSCDGPRKHKPGENEKVKQVRDLIAKIVDWPCEVKKLYRDDNAGCKRAVSAAIDWFFEHEEEGIVLEDDCLPHPDFYVYCAELLSRYRNNPDVLAIHGCNFQQGQKRGDSSYFFSRYMHVWGWASWRRAWTKNDVAMEFWPSWKSSTEWMTQFANDKVQRQHWEKVFDRMHGNLVDTWDHAWVASVMWAKGLVVSPNVNLVSNIGFRPDATHTQSFDSMHAALPVEGIMPLVHPARIAANVAADQFTFNHSFGGRNKRWPRRILFLRKDLKRLWRKWRKTAVQK